ncbi:hypothetical protein H2204_000391 [Knufia peltigerae]|uniref:Uncharacterized protein n=1 Tax=Knufia peltigerae TaxID=1002370 RepID=A0AA38YEJ7_9EURO|nr:hypothetical protein H2204_000391 [Knufia peltigerae]
MQQNSPPSRPLPASTRGIDCKKDSDSGLLLPPSLVSSSSSSSSDTADTGRFFDENLSSQESVSPVISVVDVESSDEDEHTAAIIRWHPIQSSFISAERAIVQTSSSALLLQHYLEETSTFLVAKPLSSNPFITVVLPLAWSDDLLMHSVLTLSGVHLSHTTGGNLDIQLATRQHYSLLLQNLRSVFAVLAVVCHIEAISGEPHGGIFPHLRASRQLVLKLLKEPRQKMCGDVKFIQGFALEVYFYLVLVNSITPYGRDETRAIPFDSVFTSFDFLKEYDSFGVFFSCGQGLFELIPKISMLAMHRLAEEESVESSASAETRVDYVRLVETLMEWQTPPVASEMIEWEAEHIATGEIYRQALLAFIKASMCGSVVNNPKVIVAIQRHLDTALPLFPLVMLSPFHTLLLWPVMILGSCMICEHQRKDFIYNLHHESRINVRQVREAANLLEYLWNDEDKCSYGPYGLYLVMRKHHINFSMA